MMILVKHRLSEFGRMVWIDGAMAAIAAAALGSAVLFEVVFRHTDGSTSVIVTNLAYPLGDILLLSAVAGVFALTGWKPDRTWGLIGASLLAATIADGIFLFQTATGTYSEGTILDALWPASMLLLAAAVWQPPQHVDVPLAGRPLLATSLVCAGIGLAILVFDHFHQLNLLAVSLASATLVAVTVRLVPHLPREHAHRRAVAHALRHRRPDRSRQPAPARRRTRRARSPTATGPSRGCS